MKSNIIKIIILPSVLIILLGTIYYNKVIFEIKQLIDERYAKVTQLETQQLRTLISEKQENILTISLALSKYAPIKKAILNNDGSKLQLSEFSKFLKDNTSLKNLWFQIISKDGTSIFRSFSNKKGDNLLNFRTDIKNTIQNPKINTTISVGKFDLTYKAIIPIYDGHEFIGLFESIARFNSITKKINKNGLKSILLVDKKYKKQLIRPFTKKFIDDYYIANLDADNKLINYIQNISPEKIIQQTSHKHLINQEKNFLIISHQIYDLNDEKMAYFILFKNLSDVDLSDIQQIKNNVFLLFGVLVLILYILMFYIYRKIENEEIEKKNRELQENIETKTKVLEYVSLHDSLTSLANREHFKQKLTQMLSEKESKKEIYILHIGIDKFKDINNIYSYKVGNRVLQNTANLLKKSVHKNAFVARLAADEFAIALTLGKKDNIDTLASKLLQDVRTSHLTNNNELSITISMGLSTTLDNNDTSSILLRNADTAMYKAKSLGGNNYQFYTQEMTTNLLDKIKLAHDLEQAIKNDEFEPYFQPQIDAITNEIIGMEGLIRWRHPKLGLIFPDRFIPYAEESGLIVEIDRIMMLKSILIISSWKEPYSNLKLSLNLSAVCLDSTNYIQELKTTLIQTNFNAKNLELEMLESQIMKDQENSIKKLHEIKALGISISIDDFGTGYSSLSALKKLPISKLKIDKSFIDFLPNNKDDVAIVQTIIALANALDLDLIAEGVETKEQKDFLVQNKCCNIQGYYYSKPLSQKDFEKFMIKFPS